MLFGHFFCLIAALGLSAFPSVKMEDGSGEPPIKKFKVQAEDGQSYILTLAGLSTWSF